MRSLTFLLYVLHVCRESFTSPFIHCILCFMWLGFSHLFSCIACMQGELTLCLSSSWMYIAYISLLFDLFSPLCWWFDKTGERNFRVLYMHVYFIPCFIQKGREEFWEFISGCFFSSLMHICFIYAKRGELFGEVMYVYFHFCIYVCV